MKVDIDTSDKLYADAWLGFKRYGLEKTKLMSAILFNITIHRMKAMNLSSPKRRLPPRNCGKK